LLLEGALDRFNSALDDDFNTAGAIGILFDVVRTVNHATSGGRTVSRPFREKALSFFKYANEILGLTEAEKPSASLQIPGEEVEQMIASREEARKNRDFNRADSIRDELAAMGIVLEDTPHGTRWKRS
jgi:cysteinyl-tRNA synthetase